MRDSSNAVSDNAAEDVHRSFAMQSGTLPVPVRVFFGILSLFGTVFAFMAWILIPTPIGIFIPEYNYSIRDTLISISGSLLALTGYFVWASWIRIAVSGRSFLRREWMTHLISLTNHLGWLVFFPFMGNRPLWQMCVELPGFFLWIFLNIIVALVCLIGSQFLKG